MKITKDLPITFLPLSFKNLQCGEQEKSLQYCNQLGDPIETNTLRHINKRNEAA